MAREKAKSRPSARREATRSRSGYWVRQRTRTNKNILARFDRHLCVHPSDEVAEAARTARVQKAL